MERTSSASIRLVLAMFAALIGLGVYRAATNDVTPAEAWNYDRYIGVGWQESLSHFDTNNHVLYGLLVRISTTRMHLTELSLRLPALLGGLLYLWIVFRLCRRWFGSGWLFALGAALLTLNPWVVDSLSEARGYGLAMAFWLWGLDLLLGSLEAYSVRKLNLAALCLALGVAACLPLIVPVLGLFAAFAWAAPRPRANRLVYLSIYLCIYLFIFLAIPLNRVLLSDLAQGSTRLPMREAIFLVTAAGTWVALRQPKRDPLLTLTAGSALFGVVFLLAAHRLIKAPYPERSIVYFIPILTLIGLSILRRLPRAAMLLPVGCLLIYAVRFPWGPYREGRQYVGSREIAKALRADARQRPVRVAATSELEPVMNYYRTRYRQGNWARVEPKPADAGYDYYVLPADGSAERMGLRILSRKPGIVLAAKARP